MSEQDKKILRMVALATYARLNDTPLGFARFYEVLMGNPLPTHATKWIEEIYTAKAQDKGAMIWSFRGSWKTTTLSIAFMAFRIGHDPERSNMIVQANDDSAQKTASAVAGHIEYNPGWKLVFPTVVPDKEKGWSQNGYEVKVEGMEYELWRAANAARRDPTLLGLGYKSSSLIGRHPNGCLILDDIHDEENTASARERLSVINRLTGTILPMVVEDETKSIGNRLVTWEIVVGTPWTKDDAYHHLKDTGEFVFLNNPVMERCEDGDGGIEIGVGDMTSGTHADILGWWKLAWPERFSKRIVVSWRNKSGGREFARMYMLDLSAANVTGLKFRLFPADKIDLGWAKVGGCDYASVIQKRVGDDPGRDYFSMAYGAKRPLGGLVIFDGVFEQCTQSDAEDHLKRAQGLFENTWLSTAVEADGVGEQFIAVASRNPGLKIVPMKTRGKGKAARLEVWLSPYLENGSIMISDADTPFLIALRKALDEYPHWHLDPIDATYWCARNAPDCLMGIDASEELPSVRRQRPVSNPYNAFAED